MTRESFEEEVANLGDVVMITPCHKISKMKHFMLLIKTLLLLVNLTHKIGALTQNMIMLYLIPSILGQNT